MGTIKILNEPSEYSHSPLKISPAVAFSLSSAQEDEVEGILLFRITGVVAPFEELTLLVGVPEDLATAAVVFPSREREGDTECESAFALAADVRRAYDSSLTFKS